MSQDAPNEIPPVASAKNTALTTKRAKALAPLSRRRSVVAKWHKLLRNIPDAARHLFADPPGFISIEDLDDYHVLIKLALDKIDKDDLIELLRARDLIQLLWQEKKFRRWSQGIVENALRPAARSILQELLSDGIRSREAVDQLADKLTHLAFRDAAGFAEVSQSAPEFDPQLVEAKAFQISFEPFEALQRMLSLLEARKEKAIGEFQKIKRNTEKASGGELADDDPLRGAFEAYGLALRRHRGSV